MFVGIDVSKAYLDVFIRPTSQRMRLGNDEPGIAQLVGHLESVQPTLVVLEPTGGLQTPVVAALVVRHIPVAVVNPRQIRDFGPVRPEPRPIADDQTQALDALLTRRRQLVEMITAETNRLAAAQGSRRGDSLESGMARKGRPAQDRAGGRPRRRGNATRRAPGARSPQPQADRRARRRRAAQSRQRHSRRSARHVGRTIVGALRALHGRAELNPLWHRRGAVLQAARRCGQSEEARNRGVHAQAAGRDQRHDARCVALAITRDHCLTPLTVAHGSAVGSIRHGCLDASTSAHDDDGSPRPRFLRALLWITDRRERAGRSGLI